MGHSFRCTQCSCRSARVVRTNAHAPTAEDLHLARKTGPPGSDESTGNPSNSLIPTLGYQYRWHKYPSLCTSMSLYAFSIRVQELQQKGS